MNKCIFFVSLLICGCTTTKQMESDIKQVILENKYHAEIMQAADFKSLSIIFTDSFCMAPNIPSDFRKYYKPTEQDIIWINGLIASNQKGYLRMQYLQKSILQYAGYETIAGNTKIYVAVLTSKYFKRFKQFALEKHVYFDLVVNLSGKSEYQLYALIFDKPKGSFKIEVLNK
jgi:hypothetical protein